MGGVQDGKSDENCYEIYYIRENGLKLLLAGLGQHGWYGLFSVKIDPEASVNAERTATNSILADLYQNGVVDWDEADAAVRVRKPYAGMLSAMLEKKVCVTVQMPEESAFVRCCYISDFAVVMTQKSRREDRMIGMAQLTVRGWLHLLEEDFARMEEGACCLLSCQNSEDGQIYRRIRVQKSGIRNFCIEWDGAQSGRLYCKKEELGDKLAGVFEIYPKAVPQKEDF